MVLENRLHPHAHPQGVRRRADQLAVATAAEVSLTRSIGQKMTFRRHDEVAGFFAGTDLVEPGVVPVQDWRATSELDFKSAPTAMWGGVGRKKE